jgi:hypothetical protein
MKSRKSKGNLQENNAIKDYQKGNIDNQITKNMNFDINKTNKLYEDSSLTEYKTEYIFNSEKQKRYNSIDKNNLQKKQSYQNMLTNKKRDTNNLFENKNSNITIFL